MTPPQVVIIALIVAVAAITYYHHYKLIQFRKSLWVGQHVDLKQKYEGFLSVIITDLIEDDVTVKSLQKRFYDVKRKDIYPKE